MQILKNKHLVFLKANRKEFLKITGLGLGGFLFNPVVGDSFKHSSKYHSNFGLKKDITFLNNGTMGPSPKQVTRAVKDRMDWVNDYARYGGLEKKVLDKVAQFVNVKPSEIALTHNVTEGINIAAWSLPLKKGDEVIMTGHEHVGGALPWLNRKKKDGIKIKTFKLKATAAETLEALEAAITKNTRVIAVPHIPCTIGQVLPIKEIVALAKSKNIYTVIDGAHPTGMMPLDLQDLGCDIYVSCFHKWLCGPKGTGFVFISETIREIMTPIFVGAYSAAWEIQGETMNLTKLEDSAHQYFYGTQNSALYAGIIAAIDFQNSLGRKQIFEHGNTLANNFKEFIINNSKKYELLTPKEQKSSANIISFRYGEKSKILSDYLRKKGIVTRYVAESDLFCNRISFHIYNTQKDLDLLIKEMKNFV